MVVVQHPLKLDDNFCQIVFPHNGSDARFAFQRSVKNAGSGISGPGNVFHKQGNILFLQGMNGFRV